MAYTMEKFIEDFNEDYLLHELPKLLEDERWQRLSARTILPRFSVDQRLAGLSPDEIRAYLRRAETGSQDEL